MNVTITWMNGILKIGGIKYWSKTTEFIDYMEQH